MGCCLSSVNLQGNDPSNQGGLEARQSSAKSPPAKSKATHEFDFRVRPPAEEETVKEVLSETPISIPEWMEERRKTQMAVTLIQPKVGYFEKKCPANKAEKVSEGSQISEICSVSGSFSTDTIATTASLTNKREDEVTSKRSSREGSQRMNRSPGNAPRKRPYTADGGVRERRAKSSVRRAEPWPAKKSLVGARSSVRGRKSAQLTTRKLNVAAAGIRRDPGEVSGWQSKSPSDRGLRGASKVNYGRSQLKLSGDAGHQLGVNKVRVENNDVLHNAFESLENPHIALECFIFL